MKTPRFIAVASLVFVPGTFAQYPPPPPVRVPPSPPVIYVPPAPSIMPSLPVTPSPVPVQPVQPAAVAVAAVPARAVPTQWHWQTTGNGEIPSRVIRGREAWETFWKGFDREPPIALPADEWAAVVVPGGLQPTGGYTVRVLDTDIEDGKRIVRYRVLRPAPDVLVTQAVATPWTVVFVPNTGHPIVLRREEEAPAGGR
jgi:hypothetical protein